MPSFLQYVLKLFGEIGDFIAVLLKSGIQQELKIVLPLALNAVKAVAFDKSLTTGDAKFNAAFDLIKGNIGDSQLKIGTSLVNLGIELALQKYKEIEKEEELKKEKDTSAPQVEIKEGAE